MALKHLITVGNVYVLEVDDNPDGDISMPKACFALDSANGKAYLNINGGTVWQVLGAGGTGDVVGPAGAVSGNIVVYADGTGKLVSDTGISSTAVSNHLINTSNPHAVTAIQAGADPVGTASTAVSNHVAAPDPHAQYQLESEKGALNGYASLDGGGKVPTSQLPASLLGALRYQGAWDCSSGSYPVGPETGDYYVCSIAGIISGTEYEVGDWLVYNGVDWDKVDNSDKVSSVNGATGAVVLTAVDVGALAGSGTDMRIMRWDGTSAADDSGVTLDDLNNLSGINDLTAAGQIVGATLQITTSPMVGYVLTSDASGNGTWQIAPGAIWTDAGTRIHLTTGTDTVIIGADIPTATAKLTVAGDTDSLGTVLAIHSNAAAGPVEDAGVVVAGSTTTDVENWMFLNDPINQAFILQHKQNPTDPKDLTETGYTEYLGFKSYGRTFPNNGSQTYFNKYSCNWGDPPDGGSDYDFDRTQFHTYKAEYFASNVNFPQSYTPFLAVQALMDNTPATGVQLVGYTAGPRYSGNNEVGNPIDALIGFKFKARQTHATGVVTDAIALTMEDARVDGTLVNQYGIKIPALIAANNNWAIKTEGSTPSVFGGVLTAGGVVSPTLQITTSPTAGYVLTSDASGNATWQAGSINAQDEGTPTPNTPHTTLNFTGAGVTVTDAGGGVATIAIPGGSGGSTKGYKYVNRGDVVSWDFTLTDFTIDATWRDIDMSTLGIPPEAYMVMFRVMVEISSGDDKTFYIREKGFADFKNAGTIIAQAAGVMNTGLMLVGCDDTQIFEYWGSSPAAWVNINVAAIGWFVEYDIAVGGGGDTQFYGVPQDATVSLDGGSNDVTVTDMFNLTDKELYLETVGNVDNQDADIIWQFLVPPNFTAWDTPSLKFVYSFSDLTGNNNIAITVYDTDGSTISLGNLSVPGTINTRTEDTLNISSGTFDVGKTFLVVAHITVDNTDIVRLGRIIGEYS